VPLQELVQPLPSGCAQGLCGLWVHVQGWELITCELIINAEEGCAAAKCERWLLEMIFASNNQ